MQLWLLLSALLYLISGDEMNKELLLEMKEYIEKWEVEREEEWGSGKSLQEIIAANEMPELYNKICLLVGDDNGTI